MASWILRVLRTFIATLALASWCLLPAAGVHAQQGGSEALITELAERYVGQQYGYGSSGGPQQPTLRLLPGRTPDGTSLDFVVPAGGRLIGSVVRSYDPTSNLPYGAYPYPSQTTTVDVFLDLPGDVDTAADQVEAALSARGWVAPPINPGGGYGGSRSGFQQPPFTVNRNLCRSDGSDGVTMSVVSPARSSPPSGMNRVRLTTGNTGMCNLLTRSFSLPPGASTPFDSDSPITITIPTPPFPTAARNPIPALTAPEGADLRTSSVPMPMTPYSRNYSSIATVSTAMSASALADWFGAQLRDGGWEWTSGGADGPLAWSLWRVPGDEDLLGILTAVDTPAEGERAVAVQVYSSNPSNSSAVPYPYSSPYTGDYYTPPVRSTPSAPSPPSPVTVE